MPCQVKDLDRNSGEGSTGEEDLRQIWSLETLVFYSFLQKLRIVPYGKKQQI